MLIKEIAGRMEVTPAYLEHLVTPLIIAGIIRSSVGARGGVLLGKPPDQIKLIDVFNVLEGPLAIVECVGDAAMCARSGACATRELWTELTVTISRVLASRTLADLVKAQNASVHRCPAADRRKRTHSNSDGGISQVLDVWCDDSSDLQVMLHDRPQKRNSTG